MIMHRRFTLTALAIGALGVGAAVVGGIGDAGTFFRAYLTGYTFWLSLALGSLTLALLQFLTGGIWGLVMRRVFESAAATLPLMAVLFVPVVLGIPSLYTWAAPGAGTADALIEHKQIYLNVPFFVVRAVAYLLIWAGLAWLLMRSSRAEDAAPDPRVLQRLQRLSIVGLLVLALTASFAAIDWLMSLEPDWFSTMYPGMVAMGMLLLAFAFAVLVIGLLPMVSSVEEVRQVRGVLQGVCPAGVPSHLRLGIMVEIPSAALVATALAKEVDFFSIGTNDLTQYTLAVDRAQDRIAALYQPFHPAVLRLIGLTAQAAAAANIPCGVCGEMAADVRATALLLGLGVTELSMTASALSYVKREVRAMSLAAARELADEAITLPTQSDGLDRIEAFRTGLQPPPPVPRKS
jgi:hypothetical protein